MNLRYIHYLRLVIEHGSFAAAARAAGVTQPAISHGMQRLQQHFDEPLFSAHGRQLRPTATALRAAARSRALAEGLAALSTAPHARANGGTLRVGVTASAALVCGPALHHSWCGGPARRRLELSSADEGRMLARLQGGDLDLVIAPLPRAYPASGLTHQPLYQIRPLAYARSGHPLRKAQSLLDLQSAAWAVVGPSVSGPVDVLKEAHAVRRLPAPRVVVSCPDYASLLHLMMHSDLLAVLPHPALLGHAAPGQLVALRLREGLPHYDMHLFAPSRPRPAVAALITGLTHSLRLQAT